MRSPVHKNNPVQMGSRAPFLHSLPFCEREEVRSFICCPVLELRGTFTRPDSISLAASGGFCASKGKHRLLNNVCVHKLGQVPIDYLEGKGAEGWGVIKKMGK